MLNLVIPKHLLDWCLIFKGRLSLPSLIIQTLFYIKDNNITLEEITNNKEREERRTNDRITTSDRGRESKNLRKE